jgi:hypothetical protein
VVLIGLLSLSEEVSLDGVGVYRDVFCENWGLRVTNRDKRSLIKKHLMRYWLKSLIVSKAYIF